MRVSEHKMNQGIEANLLNMIADILNIRLVYNQSAYSTWGNIFADGSATNDVKHLLHNEVDILAGSYGKTHLRCVYFDCSRPYIQESLIWCVPRVPVEVSFKNMITILTLEVWLCIFLLYFTVSGLMWCMSRCSRRESNTYRRFIDIFQNNFLVIIGHGVNVLPRTTIVRHFLGMFLIFGVVINTVYNGYFTSILSAPTFVQKYDDMEDIYKHNLNTYFLLNSALIFAFTNVRMR
ncbi:hypothetical protein NQ318_013499 [Aromia moschata]|uniref:Ionotropic glutamate receptor C-terminal domain-containing protein n=1 Tax=Aromia moschata TaxID=1265417 RepID=A0AAV8YE06_9CUCU|nr:hypothetical protein NQ318_013499 [Aromia moschata]